MEPTTNQEVITPELSAPTSNKKEGNGLKIGMVICAVLAIAGIGFGIYGMMRKPAETPVEDNTAELETELSNVKQKYAVLQNYVKELEASGTEVPEEAKSAATDASVSKNAIINGGSIIFETTENHYDGEKTITINTANGTPTCTIYQSEKDSYDRLAKKEVGNCQISGLSGKVQNVYEAGNTQMEWPYLAFLMEDGTVEYASAFESKDTGNIVIKGKINIAKFVSGIINNVGVKDGGPESAGGHRTTMFVHPDGTYTTFDDSMISE